MMVKVDLSKFFVDHRSLARIFLSHSLRLIRDVIEHIENTFNIQIGFLFCGDNEYLPPLEDARIIKEGDVLMVTRKRNNGNAVDTELVNIDGCFYEISIRSTDNEKGTMDRARPVKANIKGTVDRARPVKSKSIQTNDKNDGPKSKRQKREIKIAESEVDLNNIDEEVDGISLTPERMTQVKKYKNSEEKEEERSPDLVEESSDSEDEQQQSTNYTMKNYTTNKQTRLLVPVREEHSMKPSQVTFRKHTKVPSEEPKNRINIIETIILHNGEIAENQESKPVQHTTEKTLKPMEEIEENTLNVGDNDISKIEVCGESMDQSLHSDSTVGEKTKRKRIRKRKRPALKPTNNTNAGVAPGNFITRDYLGRSDSAPKLHLRFDDETMENDAEHSIETNGSSKQKGNSKDSKVDVVSPEQNLALLEATGDVTIEKGDNVSPNINKNPTAGDRLSFRVLRLSRNYTPEMSSSIIATVLDFENENEVITLNIEVGLEQCEEPLGKFSIESPDEVPAETNTNIRTFNWSELIEPQFF